jgi:xanthine dehydrogenase large subunit
MSHLEPSFVQSTGTTIPLVSAVGHVTGHADFLADIPPRADELCVGFVPSPAASARIVGIDLAAARAVPGVVALLTAADLPAARRFGVLQEDEPVLADGEVLYVGQPVVIVAAESAESLERARDLVRLELAETPPILSIEQALAAQRFLGPEVRLHRGNAAAEMARAPHVLQGVFHSQGQEHLYLETQAALAIPGEEGQMTIQSSTQGPTEIQRVVALVLGLGMHQVVVTSHRMGGGFGGKETQGTLPAVMAALVARATGRPARVVYRREEDGLSTGKRHAYRAEWQIGFDDEGRVRAYRVQFDSAGGATLDLSQAILERSLFHAENAYFLEHVDIRGRVCFTNHAPATAFRGFGGPQGVAVIENALQEVATYLRGKHPRGLSAADIQLRNLYGSEGRNVTPYGQVVRDNHLPAIVERLLTQCEYRRRLEQVERRNVTDRLWLRGLALVPVKFGLSFTSRLLNQANAQVLVYTDGTVQVSTGGTEMGQGLNTKIQQLVADVFGLPPARIRVMTTSTEKNNNTSPTAASASTDLNGAAAVSAAQTIRHRLLAWAAGRLAGQTQRTTAEIGEVVCAGGWIYDRRDPSRRMTFQDACLGAWVDRVDLGARGFYATPQIDFDRETGQGNPFYYFAQGATVAKVRIDRFTGELTVPRVDTLIDVGRSINPGIDRGQVIGGFVQGLGWVTNECLVYDQRGRLLTTGASTYKIPAVSDAPAEYHLEFFPTDDAVTAIAGSKGVGEPPLLHALSVWMAVKHALSCVSPAAARQLRLPATGEEILRALEETGCGA